MCELPIPLTVEAPKLVAHGPITVKGLVAEINRLRGKTSFYEIAQRSGVDLNTVTRFFSGYAKLGKTTVREPNMPGRVRLVSALAIIQALGCSLEIRPFTHRKA